MRKIILIFTLCFGSMVATAQTLEEREVLSQYIDVDMLNQGMKKLDDQREIRWKETQRLAGKNNWPLTISDTKGEGTLYDFDENGQAVYIYNLGASSITTIGAHHIHNGGSLGLNIEGQGMLVGAWEASESSGKSLPRSSHQDFMIGNQSRIDISSVHPSLHSYLGNGHHATNVASILGSSATYNNGVTRGVANKVSIKSYTMNNMFPNLFAAVQAPLNLLVSNHSYGVSVNSNSQYYYPPDYIANAAPHHLMVYAMGNAFFNYFASSKNSIGVGRCFEVQDSVGSTIQMPNSPFYSGTYDKRIKPEILAMSEGVDFAIATNNTSYGYGQNGTSFSAPAVSGAAILLQQLFKDYNPNFMYSSTLRGLIVHTAREIGGAGPDTKSGFGLLNIKKAAQLIVNNGVNSLIIEDSLSNNTVQVIPVVSDGENPLEVTLAWNDPYCGVCPTTALQLINDLDVVVVNGTDTILPWGLDTNNVNGPALRQNNQRDNIEKIQLPVTLPNTRYSVIISHKSFLKDKNKLGINKQPYSLLVSGISSCAVASNDSLIITDSVGNGQIDERYALHSVQAQNSVHANGTAKYISSEEVMLSDGFLAVENSMATIKIGNCQNFSSSKTSNYSPIDRDMILFELPNKTNETGSVVNKMSEIEVFPNPTKDGKFNFRLNNLGDEKIKFSVYDNQGKSILSGTGPASEIQKIQLPTRVKGVYYLHVNTEQKVFTQKILNL